MTTASSAPGAHGDAARRAEVRAFVRRHHPDVGGDPEAFRTGLARLREVDPRDLGDVDDPDDPRFDAPIVAVRHVTLHRLGRLGRRLARRYDPRPGSARVQ